MAITIDDFSKIWASTSPLTPYSFSDDNYKSGWNFIGGTPPSRQMWDFLQKNNDEKMQYLANNYLPLAGGTMTGNLTFDKSDARVNNSRTDGSTSINGGGGTGTGAVGIFHGKDHANSGEFHIYASDGSNFSVLAGKPDGSLKWNGMDLGGVLSYGITTVPLTNTEIPASSYHSFDMLTTTVKGIFFANYCLYANYGGTGNVRGRFAVVRNGVNVAYKGTCRTVIAGNIFSASTLLSLEAGDKVVCLVENGTNASWTTSGDDTVNYAEITRLRALQ